MRRLIVLVLLYCSTAFAKDKPVSECSSYLAVIEQDSVTVNLQMVGLNEKQSSWYRKDGNRKENAGVCILSGSPSDKRVTLQIAEQTDYMDKTAAGHPMYALFWEEHRVFVPDDNGGHYAWSANGTLSKYDPSGDGKLIPIGPVHSTNRTILSSSSVSLLKDAIKQVREQ